MNAAPLATLAQAIGLALLFAHGAAHAQHLHATASDADPAATVPIAASAPASASCECPPPDGRTPMHAPPSPPAAAGNDDAAMAHAGMDHAAMGHAAHADTASPAATASDSDVEHVGMDHATHGAHAIPNPSDMQHMGMDHAAMNHAAHADTAPPAATTTSDGGMQHVGMDHAAHGAHAMPNAADMQHTGMDHATMEHGKPTTPHADHAMHDPADHAGRPHAAAAATAATPPGAACTCADAPAAALPREPIPPLTDADRTAAFPTLRAHTMQHGPARTGYLLFDRLEGWDADHGGGQAWEASAWYGGDIDRLWLRSEGERSGGHTEAADLEALYGHAVSPWWDLLVGVKQDFAPGAARTSAAFGVQGMAPYKFEVAATLYVGEGGSASARLEGEYDVLLTNRWILQPRLEADAAFADDRARGIGSGLSTLEAGLRLRYEISRRFAPYLGVVHERAFGATADYRREAGEAARDTRVVAGVRVWF